MNETEAHRLARLETQLAAARAEIASLRDAARQATVRAEQLLTECAAEICLIRQGQ